MILPMATVLQRLEFSMANVAYHGWLGAITIPLYLAAFVVTVFSNADNTDFSLRFGAAIGIAGLSLALAGHHFNRKPRSLARPGSRFAAPHFLAFIPVQYLGWAGCLAGVAFAVLHYV